MTKILLVDDDLDLTELLAELLALEGFTVNVAYNGQDALDKLNDSYDLVLLDIMMPVLNGIETLKKIRHSSNIPVIMLTAKGDEIDRVIGLELGADDYVPKPFHDRELVARIKAILRRSSFVNTESITEDELVLKFGGLELHSASQLAKYNGLDLDLTGSEFALLYKLAQTPGNVVSREELSLSVLGKNLSPFDRSIDMHISNLRHKLPRRENNAPWFKTLRGRGYLFIQED